MIRLTEISEQDIDLLYEILEERKPEESITHIKKTTYEEHVIFVKSKPYSVWYMINQDDEKVGTIYLSQQDEVGIFIKKDFQKKGVGIMALELLIKKNPRKKFFANVNPKNFKSVQFFENFGFKLIQNTYEFTQK